MELPEKYKEMVGQRHKMSGNLFGRSKAIEPTEFEILDWRWGSGYIMDLKTMEEKHPVVEFLVKNESMNKSRWTRGFPVREIDLTKVQS